MLPTKVKSKRVTQACDFCHRRGLKCKVGPQTFPCLTCLEYGQECTRRRQPKKRGTKPRGGRKEAPPSGFQASAPRTSGPPLGTTLARNAAPALADRRTITLLLDVHLDSIHPNFPLFCERELWVGWRDGSFPHHDSDFMSLVCLCALSAQHVGDGALFNDNIDAPQRKSLRESYIAEATGLIPVDLEKSDLNLVRSYTLLALLGAQTGNNAMLHKYLGLCHGVCAQLNMLDESRWPAAISDCEREVRRRLWWSIYRLEVHTACVLGNIVRSPESRCGVDYPKGAHHPAFILGRNGQYEDWFIGWNTTTDLYRILEHAISDLRTKHSPGRPILGRQAGSDPAAIMTRLAQIQEHLLPQFVTPASRSDDSGRNRCGFQAPNIICTIYLARLLSFMSSKGDPLLACGVAGELIASIKTIPHEYIRATGSPLIQQVAGVGHVLVGIAKKHQLPPDHYVQVQNVTHSIMDLLEVFAGQSTIASAARGRLNVLLTEVEELYASKPKMTAVIDGSSADGMFHWMPHEAFHLTSPMGEHAVFPNGPLTDFTWLYPAFP